MKLLKRTSSWSLKILGSGTSSGVPLIGCTCRTCRSKDPKDQRTRSSAYLFNTKTGESLLIDPSIDHRTHALTHKITKVGAVLITHPHNDHIGGIDELRSYNYLQKRPLDLYGNAWTERDLYHRFSYIFKGALDPKRPYAIADLQFHLLRDEVYTFSLFGLEITTLPLDHGGKPCLGFRFGRTAYLTDLKTIPETTYKALEGVETLVLDCVRFAPHQTHLHLEESLRIAQRIGARKTYLTHLGHDFKHSDSLVKKTIKPRAKSQIPPLPRGIHLAYDGLTLKDCC